MNEKERKVFEMGLRNAISYREEKRNRIIKEGAIKDILIQLEIIELASQSQDPEILKRGFSYYLLLQEIIENLKIEYDKINSSKEKIESLGNEIVRKLPIPIPNILIVIGEDNKEELGEMSKFFEINSS